jgi:hypothetical protein
LHVALEYLGAVGFAETRNDRLFTRFDGLLSDDETDPSFGIEVVATCLLQKLLGPDQAKSKLQLTSEVDWNQAFDDPARQKWHEQKMASKLSRANKQLELTGLSGVVITVEFDLLDLITDSVH